MEGDPTLTEDQLHRTAIRRFCKAHEILIKDSEHGFCQDDPALRRSDASIPMTIEQHHEIQNHIEQSGASFASAQAIVEALESSGLGVVPGEAVQNMIKKGKRHEWDSPSKDASVEGVEQWSAVREVRLDVEEPAFPENTSAGLMSLALGEGEHRKVPVVNQGGLLMAFCSLKFVEHIFDVAQNMAKDGFIGQCDFM